MLPAVLTVAGSDSGGGAGIQADLRAIRALGAFGTSAVTAVTAQNPLELRSVDPVAPTVLRDQIEAVFHAFDIRAAKTGMLFSEPHIRMVAEAFAARDGCPLVVDPVMVATSGATLLQPDAIDALVGHLLPLATVLTPNLAEAALLLGEAPRGAAEPSQACALSERFGCAVFLKGGHSAARRSRDVFWSDGRGCLLESPVADCGGAANHGTGCSLSAAMAAVLARGESALDAARAAKAYVLGALRSAVRVGESVRCMWPPHELPLSEIELVQLDRNGKEQR